MPGPKELNDNVISSKELGVALLCLKHFLYFQAQNSRAKKRQTRLPSKPCKMCVHQAKNQIKKNLELLKARDSGLKCLLALSRVKRVTKCIAE
jgi:hypothetical protein